jgi:hypothetical protein
MNIRLLSAGTLLLGAALLHAQSEPAKPAADAATKEAERQGRVALVPNAQQSPTQTVQQAIAFERYKDMAAEREARKEAGRTAVSSRAPVKHTATVAKQK